ncbi:MAG: PTS sugar transporter subunit IIA [Proteobacteria bacterium]|nr:PTS sugar transporter subunit IIA [Pseudomonadota bacterium]
MIGLLVITHGELGRELIRAAEFIMGRREGVASLAVVSQTQPDQLSRQIKEAIQKVGGPQGVLVLTDMFGGTPNNISLTMWEEGKVEVATGVNLPMVIKALSSREKLSLTELASQVCSAGREAISVAGELLSS